MKILFCSDIHFDKYDFSKPKYSDWQGKVYDKAIEVIHKHIEKERPDYIFWLGDIIEHDHIHNREMEYVDKLFSHGYDYEQYSLSGNHEERSGTPYKEYFWDSNSKLLEKYGIKYVKTTHHIKEIDALIVSHRSIKSLETYRQKHKFLMSHIRWGINKFITSEIDTDNILNKFENIILGDIHSRYKDDKVIYTGVPYDIHFQNEGVNPSILKWEDGKFTWLDTLTDKYRKKLIVCEDVEEALSKLPPNDTNWYKIKVTDIALNLKRLPNLPNVTYDKKSKELEAKEELQFVKDAVTDLRTVSIEKSFIEFCNTQNTRRELSDMLESKVAGMEKVEDE
jgi:hypothetical protein